MALVAFVGVGTFLIIFFSILLLLLCVLSRITQRSSFWIAGAATLFIVALVLALSPRQSASDSAATLTVGSGGYSSFYVGQSLMAALMILSTLGACVGISITNCTSPRYARPIE